MRTLERLEALLGALPSGLLEARLRSGKPVQYHCADGDHFGEVIPPERLRAILAALADHSLYAREAELKQGYFTMDDGCRVGVCGRLVCDGERPTAMTDIGSLCVRVCREIRGASDGFYDALFEDGRLHSALIVSGPGLGKTTALRDAARRLSEDGYNVCIADERRELAACALGVPTLDVGPRTDVMDGCPKHVAVTRLLRAASPEVIVTDEIGDRRDAEALAEAARCGVRILASAHAGSLEQLLARKNVCLDVFELAVLLGDRPGQVKAIHRL